jgi:HrpA-like RNA helicase
MSKDTIVDIKEGEDQQADKDSELLDYDFIILDEAHERTIEGDLLFGLIKSLVLNKENQSPLKSRNGLKVIVMSATLEVEKLSDYFGQCPVFNIPGRTFPVHILHQSESAPQSEDDKAAKRQPKSITSLISTYIPRAVQTVFHIHQNEGIGDILVFLTGFWDIESAIQKVREEAMAKGGKRDNRQENIVWIDGGIGEEEALFDGIMLCPIYGSLESIEQRAIFQPPPRGVRKIVFATNIAQVLISPLFLRPPIYFSRRHSQFQEYGMLSTADSRSRKCTTPRRGWMLFLSYQ